jgi:hypothetical protein
MTMIYAAVAADDVQDHTDEILMMMMISDDAHDVQDHADEVLIIR